MKLIVSVALFLLFVEVCVGQSEPTAFYTCTNTAADLTGTKTLTIRAPNTFTPDAGALQTFLRFFLSDPAENEAEAGCFSALVVSNEFVITVVINDVNCGIMLTDNSDGNNDGTNSDIDVSFILAQDSTRVQGNDYLFTLTCDFLTPTTQDTDVLAITIAGAPAAGTAAVSTEAITLDMVMSDDNPLDSVNTCTLGTDVKLALGLTKSNTARGAAVVSCRVADSEANIDSTTGTSAAFITSFCADVGFGSGLPANTGFGETVVNAMDTGSPFVTRTDIFQCFKFTSTALLVIRCTATFCSTDATPTDATFCSADNCGGSGRRRRDVGHSNATMENVAVTVNVVTGPSNSATTSSRHQECTGFLHQTTFIAIVTILAVLLVLSMGATVYVGKKSRSTGSNPPPYHAKGADNPAF